MVGAANQVVRSLQNRELLQQGSVIDTLQPPTSPAPAPTGEVPVVGRGRRRNPRRPHHYLLMAMGWPLLVAITAVLVLRWRDVDQVSLIALVALTPFVLAPMVLADVIAWFSRSHALRAAATVVSAACLYTVAPFDAVIGCGASEGDSPITVMTANVLSRGGRPDAIAVNVANADPDVVIFQEINTRFIESITDQPLLDPWSYRSNDFPDASNGVVVWSKWPLSDVGFNTLDADSSVRAVVDAPQGRFTVAGVHTSSPVTGEEIDLWRRQFDGLARMATDVPMVVGGDFNATEDHRPFRQLLGQGWTDVHDDKGCGLDQTWPTSGLPFAVMRLDHILVTDHFEVLSTELGDPGGSDHYPVISRIQFSSD